MKKLAISTFVCAALALGACGGDKKKEDTKVAAKADEKKADETKEEPKEEPKDDDAAAAEAPFTHIVFGRAKVADFAKWKEAFDKGEGKRTEDGAVIHWVSQDAADPNTIMVTVGAKDLTKIKEAMASEEFKKANAEAGMEGEPEFILTGAIVHNVEPPEGTKPAGSLYVAHEVEDFGKWMEGFKGGADARKEASVITEGVVQSDENPNLVGVHVGYTDEAKIKAFAESEDLKKTMAEAGVKGEPRMYWAKLVEEKMYNAPEVAQK